jgi:hypothetical protein
VEQSAEMHELRQCICQVIHGLVEWTPMLRSAAKGLGSAILHHRDKRVTEEHYNRASSLSAANDYGRLIRQHIEESF